MCLRSRARTMQTQTHQTEHADSARVKRKYIFCLHETPSRHWGLMRIIQAPIQKSENGAGITGIFRMSWFCFSHFDSPHTVSVIAFQVGLTRDIVGEGD